MSEVTSVTVRVGGPDGSNQTFTGRAVWLLHELVQAADQGITAIRYPGVRVADCVFKLRRAGIGIVTQHEGHTGVFSGHHGRYRLAATVEVIEVKREAAEAA